MAMQVARDICNSVKARFGRFVREFYQVQNDSEVMFVRDQEHTKARFMLLSALAHATMASADLSEAEKQELFSDIMKTLCNTQLFQTAEPDVMEEQHQGLAEAILALKGQALAVPAMGGSLEALRNYVDTAIQVYLDMRELSDEANEMSPEEEEEEEDLDRENVDAVLRALWEVPNSALIVLAAAGLHEMAIKEFTGPHSFFQGILRAMEEIGSGRVTLRLALAVHTCDLIENTGAHIQEPVLSQIVGTLQTALADPHHDVRQAGAYGAGVLAKLGSPEASAKAADMLPRLHELLTIPGANDLICAYSTDNVIAALLRIFRCPHHTFVPASTWVPGLVKLLPLRRAKDEIEFCYKELLELVSVDQPDILAHATLFRLAQLLYDQRRIVSKDTLAGYITQLRRLKEAGRLGDNLPPSIAALLAIQA